MNIVFAVTASPLDHQALPEGGKDCLVLRIGYINQVLAIQMARLALSSLENIQGHKFYIYSDIHPYAFAAVSYLMMALPMRQMYPDILFLTKDKNVFISLAMAWAEAIDWGNTFKEKEK